ncbi:MAG: DASS family sodium-coupled anion symporter [Pseudomonadota bacterium]
MNDTTKGPKPSIRQRIGIFLGPIVAVGLQIVGVPDSMIAATGDEAQAGHAWMVLSLLSLMAIWWVTEAIPIPVTSLLPMVVLPLAGVMTMKEASSPYMHPIVVLLMGGFIIAKAVERWNLHARIALRVVASVGAKPSRLVGGFMIAAALLSMWISNTATSIMMMPIALSVAAAVLGEGEDLDAPFTYALLLGIAYACSIGGLGTIIGTPTNLIVAGYLNDNAGLTIDFVQWMFIGVPTVLILVPMAWFVLTRWAFVLPPDMGQSGYLVVKEKLAALGRISTPEIRTLLVFSVIAFLWIFRKPLAGIDIGGVAPFAGLTDHVIAILGVILCFLVPSGSPRRGAILDWSTAERIPWGVVLLFGGGMSLAGAITKSGLGAWIGGEIALFAALPILILIALITLFVIFATEVTSNVATASALMPVLGALALATGMDVELMAVPLALAASCAFMLPMATGPNAVVFATGRVVLPTMASAGFRLNLMAIPVITLIAYALAPIVFRGNL